MIPAPRPMSILVVDDEPSLRKLVDRILRHAGYDTLLAANAPVRCQRDGY
jgi:CheY-like chemotaxis protein